MRVTVEAIVAIVGVAVALPPAALIIWKIIRRRQLRDEEARPRQQQQVQPRGRQQRDADTRPGVRIWRDEAEQPIHDAR